MFSLVILNQQYLKIKINRQRFDRLVMETYIFCLFSSMMNITITVSQQPQVYYIILFEFISLCFKWYFNITFKHILTI